MNKQEDTNYILNPYSGRYVLKSGAIGKKIMANASEYKNFALDIKRTQKVIYTDKKIFKKSIEFINKIINEIALHLIKQDKKIKDNLTDITDPGISDGLYICANNESNKAINRFNDGVPLYLQFTVISPINLQESVHITYDDIILTTILNYFAAEFIAIGLSNNDTKDEDIQFEIMKKNILNDPEFLYLLNKLEHMKNALNDSEFLHALNKLSI